MHFAVERASKPQNLRTSHLDDSAIGTGAGEESTDDENENTGCEDSEEISFQHTDDPPIPQTARLVKDFLSIG